jgi:hypothetical protein
MSMQPVEAGAEFKAAVRRKGSFVQTLKAVAWSFFGVRKASGQEQDMSVINPVHVVIAGVLAALGLIAGLLMIVRWVVGGAAG